MKTKTSKIAIEPKFPKIHPLEGDDYGRAVTIVATGERLGAVKRDIYWVDRGGVQSHYVPRVGGYIVEVYDESFEGQYEFKFSTLAEALEAARAYFEEVAASKA